MGRRQLMTWYRFDTGSLLMHVWLMIRVVAWAQLTSATRGARWFMKTCPMSIYGLLAVARRIVLLWCCLSVCHARRQNTPWVTLLPALIVVYNSFIRMSRELCCTISTLSLQLASVKYLTVLTSMWQYLRRVLHNGHNNASHIIIFCRTMIQEWT